MKPETVSTSDAPEAEVTAAMDRRNGGIFLVSWVLIFLAAPVVYVDVVQAGLCSKLGAGPIVANLPAAALRLGNFAPFFVSWLIPHRLVRGVVVAAYSATALLLAGIAALLVAPVPDSVRIAAVIGEGLVQGLSSSIAFIYMWQCLKRGTSLAGRTRAFKLTFTAGPLAALAGSVGTQLVLGGGIPGLRFPKDFALLYLFGSLCFGTVAAAASHYRLTPLEEDARPSFGRYLAQGLRSYLGERTLVVLWIAYLFWWVASNGMANLSLYTTAAVGRAPAEMSGIILALRFGFKAAAGYGLGVLALRRGMRAPLVATACLVGAGSLWAWVAPGYAYLGAFGLMGAGELGGAYFPNYLMAFAPTASSAVHLSLLHLVNPASSIGPVLHGALTEAFGFRASFMLGIASAVVALLLVRRLPRGAAPASPAASTLALAPQGSRDRTS
jgi:hypothetical protein